MRNALAGAKKRLPGLVLAVSCRGERVSLNLLRLSRHCNSLVRAVLFSSLNSPALRTLIKPQDFADDFTAHAEITVQITGLGTILREGREGGETERE